MLMPTASSDICSRFMRKFYSHISASNDSNKKHADKSRRFVQFATGGNISASNDSYKKHADKHPRFVQFAEGDIVMLRNHPEHLLP